MLDSRPSTSCAARYPNIFILQEEDLYKNTVVQVLYLYDGYSTGMYLLLQYDKLNSKFLYGGITVRYDGMINLLVFMMIMIDYYYSIER